MKRFLHRLPLLFVVLLLLTTAVFADMGPKPQLTVVVEHAPSELYYLDLLAEGEYEYDPDFAMDETDLDPELLAAFRAAIPDGWHACIAEGTTGAPIWGKLTGDPAGPTNYHSFRYSFIVYFTLGLIIRRPLSNGSSNLSSSISSV